MQKERRSMNAPRPTDANVRTSLATREAEGDIEPDEAQHQVAAELDRLQAELIAWHGSHRSLLARVGLIRSVAPPRGLYIHGAVGRGKTMLMDLFFAGAAVAPKRRCHFHEFMSDVHDRIAEARTLTPGDPLPIVARDIASKASLLCFDEMHVTDIADAMILSRLFTGLFAADVVVVATSNAHPEALYKDGLNRQLFLPFIDLLTRRMAVVELDARKDYRVEKLGGRRLYHYPADARASAAIDELWTSLTGHEPAAPLCLAVKGRALRVNRASRNAARFSFAELCEAPLSAADYLAIAHAFHTVVLEEIPIFAPDRRDLARRFINLVDTLYDARTCLIASAAAEPAALCPAGPMTELFERTASRLTEMATDDYVRSRGHRFAPTTAPVPLD